VVDGSEDVDECRFEIGEQITHAEISKSLCNVSQTFEKEHLLETVTLHPILPRGTVIALGAVPRSVICTCETNRFANESLGVSTPDIDFPIDTFVAKDKLNPILQLFAVTRSGLIPVKNNSLVPLETERFLLQAEVTHQVALMFKTCIASPSPEPNHPHAFTFVSDFCPGSGFDQRYHNTIFANTTQFSSRSFVFAQFDFMYINCEIVACQKLPCGSCSRKLQTQKEEIPESAKHRLTEKTIVVQMHSHTGKNGRLRKVGTTTSASWQTFLSVSSLALIVSSVRC